MGEALISLGFALTTDLDLAAGGMADFADGFGRAMSTPMVTGASTCSAAFGMAWTAMLEKNSAIAPSKFGMLVVLGFIFF